MKLTDAEVGRALGLAPHKYNRNIGHWNNPATGKCGNLPAFTTSLDAIVREIEARKEITEWHVIKQASARDGNYYEAVIRWSPATGDYAASGLCKTAPLALCAALLAYLKDRKR